MKNNIYGDFRATQDLKEIPKEKKLQEVNSKDLYIKTVDLKN